MKIQKLNELTLFTDDHSSHENVVVVWSSQGPIVIDAFRLPSQFAIVQRHMEEKGYSKPALQIFTHWHSDHTLGNQNLQGVRILAHAKTREFLDETLRQMLCERLIPRGLASMGTDVFLPTETFEKELVFSIGELRIRMIHSPGHTADSSMVLFPDLQLLVSGDNLVGPEVEFYFPPVLPSDEIAGLDTLFQSYKLIRKIAPKIVIPGHGWVLPANEMLDLNEHRYKTVIKRAGEFIQRSLRGIGTQDPLEEHLIRAWLNQANSCGTMNEQETLKTNLSKVLRQFCQDYDRIVLREKP